MGRRLESAAHLSAARQNVGQSLFSLADTRRLYAVLTSIWRATKSHRKARFGGNHAAASRNALSKLACGLTARRLRGSLAKSRRRCGSQARAPLYQASASETTWSISMLSEVWGPRTKLIVMPV